jgi:DNA-binding transcriptional LysR family regulator
MRFNVARLDFVTLRLAILCAETGTLSAAARHAQCSLPTASQRLTALEAALDRKLFDRDHRGMHLTAEGALLVSHARQILSCVEEMTKQLESGMPARLNLRPVAVQEASHYDTEAARQHDCVDEHTLAQVA